MPHVYSLTQLTGSRRNEDRRTVVFTVEVRRYTLIVVAVSAVISAAPTMLAGLILGAYALLVPPAFILAGLILWDTRQRGGLRLRNYQAILDKRKAKNGVLYASGAPIPKAQLVMHQQVVIPARPTALTPGLPQAKGDRRARTRRSLLRRRTSAKGFLS